MPGYTTNKGFTAIGNQPPYTHIKVPYLYSLLGTSLAYLLHTSQVLVSPSCNNNTRSHGSRQGALATGASRALQATTRTVHQVPIFKRPT